MMFRFAWILTAVTTVLLDAFFKYQTLQAGALLPTHTHGAFFVWGLHKNPGIAFNIPIPQPIILLLTIVLIGFLLSVAWKSQTTSPLTTLGALITVLGALGNFFDRLLNGFTTDYLLFFTGSALNLSDLVILAGVFVLLVGQKRRYPQTQA